MGFTFETILSTFKFVDLSLCTSEPQFNDAGRPEYPIAEEYKQLEFLGQLFTAADCGQDRLNKIFGVKDGNYTLGSKIILHDNPSSSLIDVFKSIGYQCTAMDTSDANCQQWEISQTVSVDKLLELEPYVKEMKSDDCAVCG